MSENKPVAKLSRRQYLDSLFLETGSRAVGIQDIYRAISEIESRNLRVELSIPNITYLGEFIGSVELTFDYSEDSWQKLMSCPMWANTIWRLHSQAYYGEELKASLRFVLCVHNNGIVVSQGQQFNLSDIVAVEVSANPVYQHVMTPRLRFVLLPRHMKDEWNGRQYMLQTTPADEGDPFHNLQVVSRDGATFNLPESEEHVGHYMLNELILVSSGEIIDTTVPLDFSSEISNKIKAIGYCTSEVEPFSYYMAMYGLKGEYKVLKYCPSTDRIAEIEIDGYLYDETLYAMLLFGKSSVGDTFFRDMWRSCAVGKGNPAGYIEVASMDTGGEPNTIIGIVSKHPGRLSVTGRYEEDIRNAEARMLNPVENMPNLLNCKSQVTDPKLF